MDPYAHLARCAAFTNGCETRLQWTSPHVELRDGEWTAEAVQRLQAAGWRLDHGRWVCPGHPPTR